MNSAGKVEGSVHNANREELQNKIQEGKRLSRKRLINLLNFINFQDETITLNFKHKKFNNIISFQAYPQPCINERLECKWAEPQENIQKFNSYEFQNFVLSDGKKSILVTAKLEDISEDKITLELPETCYELSQRRAKRYKCEGIKVEFIQNSVIFYGKLIDFSSLSFRVEISAIPPQTFYWINHENPVNIILRNENNNIVFAGECVIKKQSDGQSTRTVVLELLKDNIPRFQPKEIRSIRQKLLPSPHVVFVHPIIKKLITLEIYDISGSGFSVIESHESSVLFPGMIIPELEIEFAPDLKLFCKAQVIYRKFEDKDGEIVIKCGVTFLDMDIQSQAVLSSILHHASNKKSYVCSRIDLDDLWRFFFETGFIYPKKYAHLHACKEKFKEVYERLYNRNPLIARNFVYLEKGIIQGHISMLRIFENAWLFHHHASSSVNSKAGLIVLDQISRYVNDFYRLHSTNMTYIISYFRPENRFPNRVFGGFARHLNDPKGCSVDSFACLSFPRDFEPYNIKGLTLSNTIKEDLLELKKYYENKSGGLMISALDLEPDMIGCNSLSMEYEKAGFKREKHLFSLKRDGFLKAVFLASISDIGLNLSNVTNSIHAFVIDEENTRREEIITGLSMISKYYDQDEVAVFLYPFDYAKNQDLTYEKIYNMWVFGAYKADPFLDYTKNLGAIFLKDAY